MASSPSGGSYEQNPYAPSSLGAGYATEGVGNRYPLASRGARLAAALLDGLFQMVVLLPAFVCLIIGLVQNENGNDSGTVFMIIGGLLLLVGFLVVLGVQLYLLAVKSQTLGKRIMKVRIHDYDPHEPAGPMKTILLQAFVNGLIGAVPYIGAFYGIIDVCFIFREDKRCIHDLIASTYVADVS